MEVNRRITFDKFMDYIPVASTINNVVNLIQKRVFSHSKSPKDSDYQQYITEKRVKLCLIYMIPGAKVIYRLFFSTRDSVGVKSTYPFHNLSKNIEKAYEKRAKDFAAFDQCVVDNFSKLLNSDLNRDHYQHDALEFCYNLMNISTKPYALIANDEYFGWKDHQDFIRYATIAFATKHCRKKQRRYAERKEDFFAFYNALDRNSKRLVRATFKEYGLNLREL